MSLSIDGVWKTGVWATTVWAEGVWYEGEYIPPVVDEEILAGAGYPVFQKKKFVRKPSIKEILDVAMAEIYEAGTEKNVDKDTKLAFAKIVKPFTKSKAKIPEAESVNWVALQKDAEKVDQLFKLWHQQIDDDNQMILMAYEQFY
jgi:hypothetical protein